MLLSFGRMPESDPENSLSLHVCCVENHLLFTWREARALAKPATLVAFMLVAQYLWGADEEIDDPGKDHQN